MRAVRLATASVLIHPEASYPSHCINDCLNFIDKAGEAKADLILLPEEPDVVGCTPNEIANLPELIPGGLRLEQFAERARANHIYVAYSQRERDGERVFNTGVLLDRQGALVGKYRKMHLAPGEQAEVLPGDMGYPVFNVILGALPWASAWTSTTRKCGVSMRSKGPMSYFSRPCV